MALFSKLTVLLLYPFNRNHYRPFDIEHRSPNRRRWRRAKDFPHVSTFKMAPYRSRIPFRPGCKLRGSSPRSRRALPRFHPSRALPRPPIKRLSTAAPLREETARAFIPTPFLRVLSLTPFTCDPKREFKHFPESDFNRSNDLNYS